MTEWVDVADVLDSDGPRIRWSIENQLQANLVSLDAGDQVDEHVERELDVLLVIVNGSGTFTADGVDQPVTAPGVLVLPAGTRRSIQAGPAGLAYVTAHRRRTGMSIG